MESADKKIDWISKSKGFGILGIVAVHAVQRFGAGALTDLAIAGQYCVQLFFIISSYLAFKSLDKRGVPCDKKSFRKYFFHKLVRLAPVLYIAAFWHLIARCLEFGGLPPVTNSIWRDGFFAVTFLNGLSYHCVNPWGNWYVGTLVIFFALAPWLKKKIDSPKKSVALFAAATLVCCASDFILKKLGVDTGWYFYFWLPRQFPLLALGVVFYFFETRPGDEETKNSVWTLLFIISAFFLLSTSFSDIMQTHIERGILQLAFCFALFAKAETGRAFDWLKPLGDYSYGIYLFHFCLLPLVGSVISKFYTDDGGGYGFFLCYIPLLLLSLGMSVVVNRLVEKPFFAFMKRRFGV